MAVNPLADTSHLPGGGCQIADCPQCRFFADYLRENPEFAGRPLRDFGGSAAADPPVSQTTAARRRVCLRLEADAYPAARWPEQRTRPCGQKLRRCNLYDCDCTLDPSPLAARDCLTCEQKGDGFQPRLS